MPRRVSRSGCRVAPGPAGLSPSALVLTLPSIEAAGAQPPEHPGRQFTHTGASRDLTLLLRRRGHGVRPPAPGFGPRGHGVATGDAQGRPHTRQSASRGRAATTCWNTRLHTLPGLLSQPDRTRHRKCFHRGPVNRGAHTGAWGARRIRAPAETRWTGTPATVHLSGLDTGASTAHVVDRHVQPSRRLTRKADDLPWSVLAHAHSVVTRGRLAVRVAWPEVAGPRGFFRHPRPGLAGGGLIRCRPCWATLSSSRLRSAGPRRAGDRG